MSIITCIGCMKKYEDRFGACPYCGFSAASYKNYVSQLPIGTKLVNKYIVGKMIGSGGFGITYAGYDELLGRQVAIKEYFPREFAVRHSADNKNVLSTNGSAGFNTAKSKFLKEAKALAKMNSYPGVVAIYDYFEANGTAYIVMELLEGMNLRQYLDSKGGRADFEYIKKITNDLCDILSYVHKRGILHRDISPENIYICKNGQIKLIDFGSAKQLSENTEMSTVILKQGYAPIEQYQANKKVGPGTDIYALSATIYTMISGNPPKSSIDRFLDPYLVPPDNFNQNIGTAFSSAVLKALSVKIEDRYKNVEEFKAALFNYDDKTKKELQKDETALVIKKILMGFGIIALFVAAFILIIVVSGKKRRKKRIYEAYYEEAEEAINRNRFIDSIDELLSIESSSDEVYELILRRLEKDFNYENERVLCEEEINSIDELMTEDRLKKYKKDKPVSYYRLCLKLGVHIWCYSDNISSEEWLEKVELINKKDINTDEEFELAQAMIRLIEDDYKITGGGKDYVVQWSDIKKISDALKKSSDYIDSNDQRLLVCNQLLEIIEADINSFVVWIEPGKIRTFVESIEQEMDKYNNLNDEALSIYYDNKNKIDSIKRYL